MTQFKDEKESSALVSAHGKTAKLIAARDWSDTLLGPRADWPFTLNIMLKFLLGSPVPIILFWGEHGVSLYNDAAAVFAEGRHPQQLGMTLREGWPEIADFYDNVLRVCRAGGSLSYVDEEFMLLRNGIPQQIFLNLDCSPVFGEDGVVHGVLAIGAETTGQVHAARRQEALVELDKRLSEVTATADLSFAAAQILGRTMGVDRVGYGVVNALARTVFVERNWSKQNFADVAGLHEFAQYGSYVDDLLCGNAVSNEDVANDPRTSTAVASFEALGIRSHLDVPLVEDGQVVAQMFLHSAVPRTWTRAEIAFVQEFALRTRAAIARRTAEEELRTSMAQQSETAERLQLVIENAEVGFWDVDPIFDTLIWPWRTKAMFGISPDVPVTLQDFYDGLHPDDFARTSAAYDAAADPLRRALYDVEYRTVGREDGVIRWVAAKGRGVFDEAGTCIRVAGTALEITARKQAEEQLRNLADTLEIRAAERGAELETAYEQLRQSQKLEAMGSLTGGVAHDFNNLLTPIVGTLDLLQRRQYGGEREQRLITAAVQSAERARTLVQRLLAFARRQPLQSVSVQLSQLVANMAEILSSTIGPQIKVEIDVADDLPPAKADLNQLEMALLNLSLNARDAMPDGGVLRISAAHQVLREGNKAGLAPGPYISMAVADTGIGMDEATLTRAIEPFFSTKGVGKGTGLGLSMVHGLASQLGGGLAIESTPGAGTIVELWLPEAEPVAAVSPAATEMPPVNGRGTALVVDDEELVRLSTADMLGDLGYRVVETASAEEALDAFEQGTRCDLVVTDHLMPGMTGADLARALQERRPNLPVVIVSGYAEIEGVAAGLPRLSKPFKIDELAAVLARLGL